MTQSNPYSNNGNSMNSNFSKPPKRKFGQRPSRFAAPGDRPAPTHSVSSSTSPNGEPRKSSGFFKKFDQSRRPAGGRPQGGPGGAPRGNNGGGSRYSGKQRQFSENRRPQIQEPSFEEQALSQFKNIDIDPAQSTKRFDTFDFPEIILRALKEMNFDIPTPIQSNAIPEVLLGKDLVACAQTGTGKTAAFFLPVLDFIIKNPSKKALVLAPTRELAQQIGDFWRTLTTLCPQYRCVVVTGGSPMDRQVKGLARDPHVIVATPGRLLDHMRRRKVPTEACSILVIDEADRMLDMGFAPQLEEIEKRLPRQRQNLLFSATWNKAVDRLATRFVKDPLKLCVGGVSKAATRVEQKYKNISTPQKNAELVNELNKREGSVLVFVKTQIRTNRLWRYLDEMGFAAEQMHGGRTQGQRRAALAAFKNGEVRILVATDVAARGIDVADISHVINYDLPMVAEDYIHRIGRSGRAGTEGKSLSFVAPEEKGLWNDILRLLQKTGSLMPMQN